LTQIFARDENVRAALQSARSYLTVVSSEDGNILDISEDYPPEILVDTEIGLQNAQKELLNAPVLAMDVEWPPNDRKAKASLLQLATPEKIFLIDLYAIQDNASCLDELLIENMQPPIFIFGGMNDVTKLKSSYDSFFSKLQCSRFVELQSSRAEGLATAVYAKLGSRLSKRLQCSDWGHRPLSREQMRYAALDAFVLLALADALMCNLDNSSLTAPPISFELIPDSRLSDYPEVRIAKTLALTDENQKRLLCVIPLDHRLDFDALSSVSGDSSFRLVHQGRLSPLFGFDKGSIGPIGPGAPVILDSCLTDEFIACGCGDPSWHIVMHGRALTKLASSSSDEESIPLGLRRPPSVTLASISYL